MNFSVERGGGGGDGGGCCEQLAVTQKASDSPGTVRQHTVNLGRKG